jgi:hypothetical protein
VLARIEKVGGVASARVEASGRFFLVELAGGADEARTLEGVAAALGGRARRLDDVAAAAQLAARPRGDPWLSASEVHALSYVEGRVVAVRVADAVAKAASLDAAEGEALLEAVRAEVFSAIERVHDEGGRDSTGWFFEAWPAISRAIAARARGFVDPARQAAAAAALARHF